MFTNCSAKKFGVAIVMKGEKAILFCWQIVLLFVLSFLSRPAIFVWGRTFLQFEWYHFAHSFIFEWGKFDPIH
jgi:hypothetical protein